MNARTRTIWGATFMAAMVGLASASMSVGAQEQGEAKKDARRSIGQTPADAQVAAALDRPTSFDFHETPLRDVIDFLRDHTGVNVMVDQRALHDIGVPVDTPVSISVNDLPLADALTLMLEQFDLTYVIRHGVLFVTSQDAASEFAVVRIYPIEELALLKSDDGTFSLHGEELVETLQASVFPGTWHDAGGIGTITFDRLTASLVVRNAEYVQREIVRLLSELRTARQRLEVSSTSEGVSSGMALQSLLAEGIAERQRREEKVHEREAWKRSPEYRQMRAEMRAAEAEAREAEAEAAMAEMRLKELEQQLDRTKKAD